MATPKQDLFDDSVMTFGEHLEALRTHLIRALLGLSLGVIITMGFGETVIKIIRQPIDSALDRYAVADKKLPPVHDDVAGFDFWKSVRDWFATQFLPPQVDEEAVATQAKINSSEVLQRTVTLELPAYDLLKQLHDLDPQRYPAPDDAWKEKTLLVDAKSDDIGTIRQAVKKINDPIALNVQEAFMTYLKVSFIAGLILTSPWVFYQLWLFVAAGLYPHERKYVYIYLPMSIFLFLGGAAFCFYGVFPTILDFLLGFNARMGITAQIRISEWINFAVLMPLLFGISFQLPLVMLFLQKISIFQASDYREKRRLAILGIAFLSMLLTPTPDPMSMMMMMGPLLALYELGILLCAYTASKEAAAEV